MLALKSAINLQEKHAKNPKTPRAIFKIQKAYLQLVAAGNIKEVLGDERLVEVVSQEMEQTLGLSQKQEDNFAKAESLLKQQPEPEFARLNMDIELAKLQKDEGKDLAGCCARFIESVS